MAGNASVYLFATWHGTAGGNKKRNAPDGRKYSTIYIVRSLSHDTGKHIQPLSPPSLTSFEGKHRLFDSFSFQALCSST